MYAVMTSHLAVLKLNTRLFNNCFDGVDDAAALKRFINGNNNMAFLAIHLVDARYYLAGLLGVKAESPFKGTLDDVNGIDDIKEYPELSRLLNWWSEAGEILEQRFASISDEELGRKSPQDFPLEDKTILGAVAFLLEHESFHIGQLAFLRKHAGLDPMSYD